MKEMTLQNIAKACNGELRVPDGRTDVSQEVSSVVLDSRKVVENSLFVATVGARVDGHQFISTVFTAGACCVVTEKAPEQMEKEYGSDCSDWGAYILVENSFQALKDIAEFYRSTLKIPIVGITGSVGKTSTKEFIAGVLSEQFCVLKTEGNFNNEIGLPLTILRIRPEHQVAVIEMGISDFGEMHRLSKIARPNICVITNIGQCHLETLKSRDGILKAKSEIFDYMDSEGEVCLNGDDDKLACLTSVHGKAPHFFGLGDNDAEEVFADQIVSKGLFGSEAMLHVRKQAADYSITVPLPGIHMVINAAAAACVAGILGLNQEQITEGIAKMAPNRGRSNLIQTNNYTIIDDCYNANPVSVKAAIDLLKMADTQKTVILGDMFELGVNSETMHKEVGAYAALAGLDTIICIGELAEDIYKAACQNQQKEQIVLYYPNKEAFLKVLRSNQETVFTKGDTILVKASHGMGFAEIVQILEANQ